MAQKTISELQLRDEVEDTLNFPSDDGIQSYRVTASQVKSYILPNGGITRALLANGAIAKSVLATKTSAYTVDISTDDVIAVDCSAGDITITLPAAASSTGKMLSIYKKDANTSGYKVTIDGNSAELVGSLATEILYFPNESRLLFCDGVGWKIIGASYGLPLTKVMTDSEANSTTNMKFTRDRKKLYLVGETAFSGAFSGTTFNITIPTEFTLDTSFYASTVGSTRPTIGTAVLFDANGNTDIGTLDIRSTTEIRVTYHDVSGSIIRKTNPLSNAPFTWANGDYILTKGDFEVAAWQ